MTQAAAQTVWTEETRQALVEQESGHGDALERLADVFSSGAGSVIAWVLLGAAVIAAVALATRLGRTVRRDAGVAGPVSEAVVVTSARDWLERARGARADGDNREAVRCAHRALIAGLAARGLVDEVPGTTVGEYRQALRGAPSENAIFRIASRLGMDLERLRRDMQAPSIDNQIQINLQLARQVGVRGTPAFIVGDQLVPGAMSPDQMRQLIARKRGS